jgi:hypothetical protein
MANNASNADQANFVQTVRAVELALGMSVPNHAAMSSVQNSGNNLNTTLIAAAQNSAFSSAVQQALRSGLQDLQSLASTYGLGSLFIYNKKPTNLLYTKYAQRHHRDSPLTTNSASWMSIGNSIIHPTLPVSLLAIKLTTIICITTSG